MAIEMFEADPAESLKTEIVRNMAELDELVDEILISSRLQAGRTESFEDMVDLVAIAARKASISTPQTPSPSPAPPPSSAPTAASSAA